VFTKLGYTEHIHHNIWRAKMKVAGVPDSLIVKLMDRIYSNKNPAALTQEGTRLTDVILFFARYCKEFDASTCNEVID
ncbi:hypothetical protein, partial [Streptomyces europaeiscabiei]|uniref:hypothetical protein n=1 Tax=Streptomyces europaeiscabiei TaxID=146819 RepID=UPI0038F7A765